MPNRLKWFYSYSPNATFPHSVAERIREGRFISVVFSAFRRQHAINDVQWIAEAPRREKQAREDIRLLVHMLRARRLTEIEQQTLAIIEARNVEPKIEARIRVADKGDRVAFGYGEPKGIFHVAEVDADGMLFLEELKDWYHPEELVKVEGR